nr:MAG TPA: Pentaerythritol tetranitrate reductase [Caudoviricetes sp.]DAY42092.1 MAG TPA: Pentaerythritol tetranitrate reductase [Caudoviricetes sp.]
MNLNKHRITHLEGLMRIPSLHHEHNYHHNL